MFFTVACLLSVFTSQLKGLSQIVCPPHPLRRRDGHDHRAQSGQPAGGQADHVRRHGLGAHPAAGLARHVRHRRAADGQAGCAAGRHQAGPGHVRPGQRLLPLPALHHHHGRRPLPPPAEALADPDARRPRRPRRPDDPHLHPQLVARPRHRPAGRRLAAEQEAAAGAHRHGPRRGAVRAERRQPLLRPDRQQRSQHRADRRGQLPGLAVHRTGPRSSTSPPTTPSRASACG